MRAWWEKLSALRTRWAASRYFEKQAANELRTERIAEELDQVEKGVRHAHLPPGFGAAG